ncbi:hypothetical protein BGZ75_000553 [Mortierella antarctica]|nr:hypothetical protein BGZ75_000553 [Mortierella antarctica]
MKTFTIVLGLIAALAVSDVVSAGNDVRGCGNEKAVRCIGLRGDKFQDTQATITAIKSLTSDRMCQCKTDKNHLYIVANNNFEQAMQSCAKTAYRGKVCGGH